MFFEMFLMKKYEKILLNLFALVIIILIGNAIMNAGGLMVGQSGVSQEVVNAIIGTDCYLFGIFLIVYSIYKSIVYWKNQL
jgi:uncharacterized membrane protein